MQFAVPHSWPCCLLLPADHLLHFFVRRMVAASPAKLLQLESVLVLLFIPGGRVVAIFAVAAL
jgi:hypothetical protein